MPHYLLVSAPIVQILLRKIVAFKLFESPIAMTDIEEVHPADKRKLHDFIHEPPLHLLLDEGGELIACNSFYLLFRVKT